MAEMLAEIKAKLRKQVSFEMSSPDDRTGEAKVLRHTASAVLIKRSHSREESILNGVIACCL